MWVGQELKTFNYEVIPVWIMYNAAFVISTLGWGTVSKQQLYFLLNATTTSTLRQVRRYARVCTNCACAIVVLGILLACSGSPHNALHSSSNCQLRSHEYLQVHRTTLEREAMCPHYTFTQNLFTTHTYLTFVFSLINADGRNAAMDPRWGRVIHQTLLSLAFLAPPIQEGSGNQTTPAWLLLHRRWTLVFAVSRQQTLGGRSLNCPK